MSQVSRTNFWVRQADQKMGPPICIFLGFPRKNYALIWELVVRSMKLNYGGPFWGNLVCEGFSAPFLRPWVWSFDWAALVLSWCSRVAT